MQAAFGSRTELGLTVSPGAALARQGDYPGAARIFTLYQNTNARTSMLRRLGAVGELMGSSNAV